MVRVWHADKNIPPETLAWLAKRANAWETVVVKGASHVLMVSHPENVAKIIETRPIKLTTVPVAGCPFAPYWSKGSNSDEHRFRTGEFALRRLH